MDLSLLSTGDNDIREQLPSSESAEGGRKLKDEIWEESKKTWKIAFPAILYRVTSFGTVVVTQVFIGRISQIDLAAFALVQTILIRFVNGILVGMSSATETLCGQAFGAKQYHMLGIYLQRSWIVDSTTATITTPLFIFSAPLFRLLGQEEDIAIATRDISLWFLPYIYGMVFNRSIQMYLQAQLKNMIVGWLSAFSFVLHVFLSWIFVCVLKFGANGAMMALNISNWSMVIGAFVYVFGGWCPKTWRGFTFAAFVDLLPVVKLSISSAVMLCLQLWYYAVLLLLAGYLKNAAVSISAFSICLNISTWVMMLTLGFLGATSVRVSNELGKGNARAAKFAMKYTLSTSICFGVFFWILCLVFGHGIAYLFTSSEEVAEAVSSLSVLLAFSILLNSIQPVLSGVAVGAGLQVKVAYINVGSYYIVGIPLGVLLGYVAHLSVKGMWIGMICGVIVQGMLLTYMTWKTDWNEQVKKTSERLDRWFLKPSEESDEGPLNPKVGEEEEEDHQKEILNEKKIIES